MANIKQERDRYLTLLRNKIREKGFTQLEVQEALGWGQSYISQLLTKQKNLRLEQVLSILHVIGIDPNDFFAELYAEAPQLAAGRRQPLGQFRRQEALIEGLAKLLLEKGLVTTAELSAAIQAAEDEPMQPN